MEPITLSISSSNSVKHDRDYLSNNLTNKFKGELGEQFVCEAFEDAIVLPNIKTTKFGGDIDSIIIEDGVLFWIEVKNVNENFKIYNDWHKTHVESRFDDKHEYIVQIYADEYKVEKIEKLVVIPFFDAVDSSVNDVVKDKNLHIIETHRQALTQSDKNHWKNAIKKFKKEYFADKEEECTKDSKKESGSRSVKINKDIALGYGLDYGFRVLFLVLFIKKYYLKHFIEHFAKQKTSIFQSTISDELEKLAHFTIHPEINEYNLKGGLDLSQARGRVSKLNDMNDIHYKTLYLLGKLDDYGVRPLNVDRITLLKYVMGILMCSRRCANRWVNFLYRLSWKDWY